MMDKWTLELRLSNGFGVEYVKRIDLGRECVDTGMSPRLRDQMDLAAEVGLPLPGMPFEAVVTMMKKRDFRRDLLIQAAKRLGDSMADYMEDGEGWHGVGRAEKVESHRARALAEPPHD